MAHAKYLQEVHERIVTYLTFTAAFSLAPKRRFRPRGTINGANTRPDENDQVDRSRIEPAEGEISQAALAHYRRLCEGLRARGVDPVVTFQ